MYKKILVPVDGSQSSLHALKTAGKLAKLTGGQILILHVSAFETVEQVGFFGLGYAAVPAANRESREAVAKKTLADLKAAAQKHLPSDIKWTAFVDFGHSGELICEYAQSKNANLIIMGSRGMGVAKSLLLGSVSGFVVGHAKTPVMIIKENQ